MRFINTYRKSFNSCIILLLLFQTNTQSQDLSVKSRNSYKWFISVSGGPVQTKISIDGTPVISGVDVSGKYSYCMSVNAGYIFSKYFGLSTGIGLSPYFTRFSLDTYSNSLDTVDSENESYERRIAGNNIKETPKIYFLEIPVILNFQYPFGRTIGFYAQSGINMAIPVSKRYSGSGIFTYTGYYPAYNVLLMDIPYEGFKSNVENKVTGDLKVKSINPELVASGGFYFCTEKRYQISAGFFYKKMLADISAYPEVGSFQLSTHENQLRSLMEGSEKTSASSMGVVISLRYYIK